MNQQETLEMHLMGHAKQLIVVIEGGKKVEKEEPKFTLRRLVSTTRRFFAKVIEGSDSRFSFVRIKFGFSADYSSRNVM